jgi:RNA polymerase sigma factor (sigma-70 family)
VLRHVEQLTTSEIAERLQITQNTCRQRHLRALKKLRELFVEAELSWGDLK